MKKSLLAHIAADFISQYENVANSGVCYLLNEYPTAREALAAVLGMDTAPTRYETERATQSGGRLDVAGVDTDGKVTVIIEGKFWANLMDGQPGDYLKELDASGRLMFLAPDQRIRSLELEVAKRTDNKRVLVRSWNKFLDLVGVENKKNYDDNLAGDLDQLKALCQKMDTEGMPPLSASDLDPMNGKRATHLVDVIDECRDALKGPDYAANFSFSGLKATGMKYGYGVYLRGYNFACCLYFSSWDWYAMDSHAPIWLDVKDSEFNVSQKINHALHAFDADNSYEGKLGIMLKPGMDKGQVRDHVVKRVDEALKYLNERIVDE